MIICVHHDKVAMIVYVPYVGEVAIVVPIRRVGEVAMIIYVHRVVAMPICVRSVGEVSRKSWKPGSNAMGDVFLLTVNPAIEGGTLGRKDPFTALSPDARYRVNIDCLDVSGRLLALVGCW